MISTHATDIPAGRSLLRSFRFDGLQVERSGETPPAAAGALPRCDVLLALDFAGSAGPGLAERLGAAAARIGDGGILLLALPNRFALRFWSGCPEPASGRLFATLGGADAAPESAGAAEDCGGPRLFVSRRELAEALQRAGLTPLEWFLAAPDPAETGESGSLLSERLVSAAPELAADIAWAQPSADRLRPRLDLFAEALVGRELARSGLLTEFASHFLVAAAAHEAPAASAIWPRLRPPAAEIGWHFATGRRESIATVFELGPAGITVAKQRPGGTPSADLGGFRWQAPAKAALAPGEPLRLRLLAHLVAGRGAAFLDEFSDFFAAIRERFRPDPEAGDEELAGEALDALLTNATRDAGGAFHLFDLEWRAAARIPASWWILRNVVACLGMRGPRQPLIASGAGLYERLCRHLGVAPRLEADLAREAEFAAAAQGARAGDASALAAALAEPWPVAVAQGLEPAALRSGLELATAHQDLVARYRELEVWSAEAQQRSAATEAEYRRLESWATEVQAANNVVLAEYRRLAEWASEIEAQLRQRESELRP